MNKTKTKENENKLFAPNFRTVPSCYSCDKYDHTKYVCKEYIFDHIAYCGQDNAIIEPWNKICDSHPTNQLPESEKELK